jgi:GT2 family glycosyltransferase
MRVSVIIPAYNVENFLSETIKSVLNQTYPVNEVIVVDDGSTDRTADVAASFGHPVHLRRQDNAGAAAARNLMRNCCVSGHWISLRPHGCTRQHCYVTAGLPRQSAFLLVSLMLKMLSMRLSSARKHQSGPWKRYA